MLVDISNVLAQFMHDADEHAKIIYETNSPTSTLLKLPPTLTS